MLVTGNTPTWPATSGRVAARGGLLGFDDGAAAAAATAEVS